MGGYYTPKMKEIKEVMVPPLVHLSQTAPIPPAFPSTGTYGQTQSLCGQEYVSPSSTVFVYKRYFKQVVISTHAVLTSCWRWQVRSTSV